MRKNVKLLHVKHSYIRILLIMIHVKHIEPFINHIWHHGINLI